MPPDPSLAHPTPGRRSRLLLDAPDTVLREPAVYVVRVAEDLARTDQAQLKGVRLVEGAGWQLEPIRREEFTAETARYAPKHLQAPTQSGGFSLFLQKQIAAGESDESNLDSDAALEPAFSEGGGFVDRIMVTLGDVAPGRPIYNSFYLPSVFVKEAYVNAISFSGPPTVRAFQGEIEALGTGQWRLVYRGDGRAILQEKVSVRGGAAAWQRRGEFRFCPPGAVGGYEHETEIVAIVSPSRAGGYGGVIRIQCDSNQKEGPPLAISTPLDPESFLYRVRQDADPGASNGHPIRVDELRAIRPRSQVALATYPTTGTLLGDPLHLEGPMGTAGAGEIGGSLRLTWRAETPGGSSVQGDLLIDGEALPAVTTGSSGLNSWKEFSVPDIAPASAGHQPKRLLPRFTLTGSGSATPTLKMMRVTKAPVAQDIAPPALSPQGRITVDVLQEGDDPSGDSASFTLSDEYDAHSILRERGRFVVELSTEYPGVDWSDPANDAKRSVLFRGLAISPESNRRGAHDPLDRHASGEFRELSLTCVGPWARVEEAYAPQLIDFMVPKDEDAATGSPWKAADAIYLALTLAGVSDEMLDIPEFETRFFAGQEGTKLEPGASLVEFARRTAKEMFRAAIVFDPNASRSEDPARWRGMWRMILPKSAPYRPLATFVSGPEGDGVSSETGEARAISATAREAYPDRVNEGVTMPGTFILRGSSRVRTRPPEANKIVIVGGAPDDGGKGGRLQVVFFNAKSYDAIPGLSTADPAHPDYSGSCVPLRFVDSRLQTIDALTFIGRRLYDSLAHGRKLLNFEAPLLLVTDPNDPFQRRPRPLRFFDPVLVNGEEYIVRSLHPSYKKDAFQTATHELERPSDGGITPGVSSGPLATMRAVLQGTATRALGLAVRQVPTSPGEGVRQIYAGEYERLPIVGSECAMDLDPESDRYLQPAWLLGYDGIEGLGI